MKRSSLMRAIGCLTLASVGGCSSAAHPLGGEDQKIDGNGGSTSTGNRAASGNGGSTGKRAGDSASAGNSADSGKIVSTGNNPGNSDAGAVVPSSPPPQTAFDPSSSPCGPCGDFIVNYGQASFTFGGCCLPGGVCGVDTGTAATWVHANGPKNPDGTEVDLRIPHGCVPRDQVGVPDTSCPSMGVTDPNEFEGCCRSDGTCGVNLELIQAGCVQPQRTLVGPNGNDAGTPDMPLPPQPCNYPH